MNPVRAEVRGTAAANGTWAAGSSVPDFRSAAAIRFSHHPKG